MVEDESNQPPENPGSIDYHKAIYDIQGDRTRAVNEYSKAKQTADDTGGAQAEAEKSLKKAYSETAS